MGYRIEQLIGVLDKLSKQPNFKISLEAYEDIFDIVEQHGKIDMVFRIFKLVKKFNLQPSAKMISTVLQAIAKNNELVGMQRNNQQLNHRESTISVMTAKQAKHADLTAILSHQTDDSVAGGRVSKAMDVHSPYSKYMRGIFRSRTFKTYKERYNSLIDDVLTINVEEICTQPECRRVIKAIRLKTFKSRKDGI